VVVGVEVGHGKRHGVLSDYTFAVRDEAAGRLVTIGKAYSGLTDAEIAEMTRWFEEHTISRHGRHHLVQPSIVVEVAFDVILRSNRHKSGFTLRFPRIAHLRLDKQPEEADTVETVRALYDGLQAGTEHLVTAAARDAERRAGPVDAERSSMDAFDAAGSDHATPRLVVRPPGRRPQRSTGRSSRSPHSDQPPS
jgi:hypothetical protein